MLLLTALLPLPTSGQEARNDLPRTRVVMLGTGTPNAEAGRSGPATAVVVDGHAYVFDAGYGVMLRSAEAVERLGIEGLRPPRMDRVFLTHLHSDHTVGLPDILLRSWVLDRPGPLHVVGPPGTEAMMEHIQMAWSQDIAMRIDGSEPRDHNRDAYRSVVRETRGGLVHEDERVRIHAVPVPHGSWEVALAYRIEGPDRTVVISGDAAPSDAIVAACAGCDVLVHEVYSASAYAGLPEGAQRYHGSFHTSARDLGRLASRAEAKAVVLVHHLLWGATPESVVAEVREHFEGPVLFGTDGLVY